MPSIRDVSHAELLNILAWLQTRPNRGRPTILVGGWAVFAMNPYTKSRDIDLVLSAKERERLLQWLKGRGYSIWRKQQDGWWGAYKVADPDAAIEQDRKIVIDIATYEEHFSFEGRQEQLNFDLAIDQSREIDIDGYTVMVPTPSLLVLYKLKAVYDRTHRLTNGTSKDADYDAEKLIKDKADVLAITHAAEKNGGWDVEFMGGQLQRLNFLVEILRALPDDEHAVASYGGLDANEARQAVNALLSIVT